MEEMSFFSTGLLFLSEYEQPLINYTDCLQQNKQ